MTTDDSSFRATYAQPDIILARIVAVARLLTQQAEPTAPQRHLQRAFLCMPLHLLKMLRHMVLNMELRAEQAEPR